MTKSGFGKLASLDEAFDIIARVVKKKGNEKVMLKQANNRILAEDIKAPIDVPHFRKSAMDGFAVIADDTFGASNTRPKKLGIIESVTAGVLPKMDIKSGECIEITTGAPLPKSATAVMMVEYTEKSGDELTIYKTAAPGDNVINIGTDIKKGSVVFRKGIKLNPRYVGVLSALGLKDILVKQQPRVAYFSTGNEILLPDENLQDGKVYDINSSTIIDTLVDHGCKVSFLGVVRDSLEDIKNVILSAIKETDLVLLSGGSSLGGEDFMIDAVAGLGTVLVHGIAAKPGKPVLIGEVKGKLVLGLPGYPTSALSNTYTLVLPVLYRMMGSELKITKTRGRLSRKVASTIGRYEFLAVRLDDGSAVPVMKGSSAITTMAEADGYICIDENTEVVDKDEMVEVNMF